MIISNYDKDFDLFDLHQTTLLEIPSGHSEKSHCLPQIAVKTIEILVGINKCSLWHTDQFIQREEYPRSGKFRVQEMPTSKML